MCGKGLRQLLLAAALLYAAAACAQGTYVAENEVAASIQEGSGAPKDPAAALEYYMKASKQGVPEAQYALGLLYEYGEGGVKQSYYQARTLYMWASGSGYSPATYRVGVMYEEGKGVRPSMAAALLWYRKAAAMGNEDALARLEAMRKLEEEMNAASAEKPGDGRKEQSIMPPEKPRGGG
jgi:TPR repeat protein